MRGRKRKYPKNFQPDPWISSDDEAENLQDPGDIHDPHHEQRPFQNNLENGNFEERDAMEDVEDLVIPDSDGNMEMDAANAVVNPVELLDVEQHQERQQLEDVDLDLNHEQGMLCFPFVSCFIN